LRTVRFSIPFYRMTQQGIGYSWCNSKTLKKLV
jgi:hypothetical protein